MNKFLIIGMVAALTGCATVEDRSAYDNLPEGDPKFYAAYGNAMTSTAELPLTVNWQNANREPLERAVKPETLAEYLASDEAADSLLAEVKTAYASDPLVLTMIAAITQRVMTPGRPEAPAERRLWVGALERAYDGTTEAYRRAFFRDQLNWCGYR